jgi:cytochrome b6-f complex iron-sulfur subunit
MDRKEFLTALGYSSGALIFAACLGGCKKTDTTFVANQPVVDFTLDLTKSENAALNTNGGYIYANGVIVAKTAAGAIIAVSQECTHQGTSVQYKSNTNEFYCPNHGANFSITGTVVNGPSNGGLKSYAVLVTGNFVNVKG